MGPEAQQDGLGRCDLPALQPPAPAHGPPPTPSCRWDTHKYVEERGLKIVLDDFTLQVLLDAILGLERRRERRKLSSALIRK